MNVKKIFIIILVVIICIKVYSYRFNNPLTEDGEYRIRNIRIYKDTPAWKLALAVNSQNTKTIEKIIKGKPELLNYQEPKYGATLLLWAVGTEKYKSAEMLLKCGANPNIASTRAGETPLFVAAGYSWVDNDAKKDPKYVKLLLNYGADPNKNYAGGDKYNNSIEPGTSPLMASISCGIEKTKALVGAGADINHKTSKGRTAAIVSLVNVGPNSTLEAMEYAHYLIVDKEANIKDPYYRILNLNNANPDDKFYPVNLLRYWICDLDSDKYKIKMEIVEEFARQGVNYWDTKISNNEILQIKKRYPNTWQKYIKKY